MGFAFSKNFINDDWKLAEQDAREIYNYRILQYDPADHGPPMAYMKQIQTEYNVNCIPKYIRNR